MQLLRRFIRQTSLAEVGELGQARLLQQPLVLPVDLDQATAEFARAYARAAGIGELADEISLCSGADESFLAPPTRLSPSVASAFRHPAPRAVGHGAAHALHAALTTLQLLPHSSGRLT